jgi:hypothetical protein
MRLFRTVVLSSLTVTLVATAVAQIRPPVVSRSAPVRISPSSGFHVYQYGSPNLSFVWQQHPAMALAGQLPTHFLFCLKRISDGDCSHATAVATLLPNQIPRMIVRSPLTLQPIATRYTYTPTIPDEKLDYLVAWQVLGCTTNADASCLHSSHAWMVASTLELEALNISGNVSGNNYVVTTEGINHGTRSLSAYAHPVHNAVWVRTVLIDSTNSVCRTDPNAADIRGETTLYVIDRYGRMTQFANLPRDANNRYIANDVVAIYRWGDSYDESEMPSDDIAPGQTRSVGSLTVSFMPNQRPRALAAGVSMDSDTVLQEADEINNGHAECEVFF